MKITIKGNPKEIAELAAILQARQTAQSEKAAPQGEAAEQDFGINYTGKNILDDHVRIIQSVSERLSEILSNKS